MEVSSCKNVQGIDAVRFEKQSAVSNDCVLRDLSELFKLFGDSTRLGILLLLDESEMCVCEISQRIGMTKSAVSHQLKSLRDKDLVRFERRGKHIYYSLADSHVKDIIEKAIEHIREDK